MKTSTMQFEPSISPLQRSQVINGRNDCGQTKDDLKAIYRAYLLEIRTRRALPVLKGLTWHEARRRLKIIRDELLNGDFTY